jgi:hypothetical protein
MALKMGTWVSKLAWKKAGIALLFQTSRTALYKYAIYVNDNFRGRL